MRLEEPKAGTTRVRKRFALWPILARNQRGAFEWRWLEFVEIEEVRMEINHPLNVTTPPWWEPVRFLN